jgi:hypothetical protein
MAIYQDIKKELEVVENHLHPHLSVTTPSGRLRVGALTFNSAATNGQTITLAKAGSASMVYTYQDVLTAPAAGNCRILTQGTAKLTAQMLMYSMAGVDIPGVIKYYNDIPLAKPDFVAAYTGMRVSIGSALHPATGVGDTLVFICKVGDSAAACTLSDTLTHAGIYKLTAFTRIYSSRYVFTANVNPATDSIAGPYQTIIPMMSVWYAQRSYAGYVENTPVVVGLADYDVGKIIAEVASSNALIYECDAYWSLDELTFYPLWHGLELSRDEVTRGCQAFIVSSGRVPAGAGFYIRGRCNSVDPDEYIDLKAQYHIYPPRLSD